MSYVIQFRFWTIQIQLSSCKINRTILAEKIFIFSPGIPYYVTRLLYDSDNSSAVAEKGNNVDNRVRHRIILVTKCVGDW